MVPKSSSRIKLFMWGILPTKDLLLKRKVQAVPYCVVCGAVVKNIWYTSSLRLQLQNSAPLGLMEWFSTLLESQDEAFVQLFAILAWKMWEHVLIDLWILYLLVLGFGWNWIRMLLLSRIPTPRCIFKLNTDASTSEGGGVSCGCAVSDRHGDIILAARKHVSSTWEPVLAEVQAIKFQISLAVQYGFWPLCFRSQNAFFQLKEKGQKKYCYWSKLGGLSHSTIVLLIFQNYCYVTLHGQTQKDV